MRESLRFALCTPVAALFSVALKLPRSATRSLHPRRGFLVCGHLSSFAAPSHWCRSRPYSFVCYFFFLLPYPSTWGFSCLLGGLASSASIQWVFCRSSSTCRCISTVSVYQKGTNSQRERWRARPGRVPSVGASVSVEFGGHHSPNVWMGSPTRKLSEPLYVGFLRGCCQARLSEASRLGSRSRKSF